MKKLSLILCLFLFTVSSILSQPITVLNKNECYVPPNEGWVAMDKYTFAKYHYSSEKLDTLKREVVELDSMLRQRDVTQNEITAKYEQVINSKQEEISIFKTGYDGMKTSLEQCSDKNNELRVEYKKLEDRHGKVKRWRNRFLGASAFSTGVLVLILLI